MTNVGLKRITLRLTVHRHDPTGDEQPRTEARLAKTVQQWECLDSQTAPSSLKNPNTPPHCELSFDSGDTAAVSMETSGC